MDPKQYSSRQKPTSCRFCRSRKLRCNRESPCSNCVSRGLRCKLDSTARLATGTVASDPELLQRIRRLEQIVDSPKGAPTQSPKQPSESSDPQSIYGSAMSSEIENLDSDIAFLQDLYTSQDLSEKPPSNMVVFRLCPMQQIKGAQPYVTHSTHPWCPFSTWLRCVWLPQYHEAKILLEKFIQDIDAAHHVIHTPSLLPMMNETYYCLSQHGQVKSGSIILLLGIFASATHCWMRHDEQRGLFSTAAEANSYSSLWIKTIEDVIDIAHRTTSVSVEGIQGICIAMFPLIDVEGFSRRCKSLVSMALLLARELGLHQLDHPSNSKVANTARAEIGRRVWWYLVATDWSIPSKLGGFSRGIYQCNPRHMLVDKPLNLNDEDLVDGMSRIGKPFSQPTAASYSLLRIRFSEISRHMVDRSPIVMSNIGELSHDVVLDIDTEIISLIAEIPQFFSMSVEELMATFNLDAARAAGIVHQGNTIFSLAYARRCALHFPYFTRGFVDPIFASSKDICLRSARLIIQTELRLRAAGQTVRYYRYCGLIVATFMASIVLLINICHSKTSRQQEKEHQEVADAIRILEEERFESGTAARFLDTLMEVLRKHNVLVSQGSNIEIRREKSVVMSGGAHVNDLVLVPMPLGSPDILRSHEMNGIATDETTASGDPLSTYFNELAQSFEHGIGAGNIGWDDIFSDLNSSFV